MVRSKVPDSPAFQPAPIPLAILLCDDSIRDSDTKKITLVGIFDQIKAKEFPTTYRPVSIYLRLIDAEGIYKFRIEFVLVSDDKILVEANINAINIPNRLEPFTCVIKSTPLELPKEGQYEFRVWANDRYIGRAGLLAMKTSEVK